ncbi:MAG: DUF4249 domain-containing protein, partial [Cyclobacteriaceae bacterium]|nr:DUF4249 domain-containing protein [Cyclobacteriaceae bacterium]
QNIPSSGVKVTTTSGQAENRLSEFPLIMVEEQEPYLSSRYSLSVKQFSISSKAYQYYKDLKENNESAGSFFDKQKGTILGNISNMTHSSAPALGYFEVAGVSEKWKLFNPDQWFDEGFRPVNYYSIGCKYNDVVDTVVVGDLLSNKVSMGVRNIYYITITGEAILVPTICSDCRIYGVLKKPDFWD